MTRIKCGVSVFNSCSSIQMTQNILFTACKRTEQNVQIICFMQQNIIGANRQQTMWESARTLHANLRRKRNSATMSIEHKKHTHTQRHRHTHAQRAYGTSEKVAHNDAPLYRIESCDCGTYNNSSAQLNCIVMWPNQLIRICRAVLLHRIEPISWRSVSGPCSLQMVFYD